MDQLHNSDNKYTEINKANRQIDRQTQFTVTEKILKKSL